MQEERRSAAPDKLVLLPGFGGERDISVAEQLLRQRVEALEERLEQMKVSRRVLMRILERAEQDKQVELDNLRRENMRLRRHNLILAKSAWQGNARFMRLKQQQEPLPGRYE